MSCSWIGRFSGKDMSVSQVDIYFFFFFFFAFKMPERKIYIFNGIPSKFQHIVFFPGSWQADFTIYKCEELKVKKLN